MVVIAALLFGFLAFVMLANAFQSFRAQAHVAGRVSPDEEHGVRKGLRRSARSNVVVGLSFALAAFLFRWNWPLALAIGVWPILAFALLFATGNVDVISKLSE